MRNYLKDMSFEEAKEIIRSTKNETISRIKCECGGYDGLINYVIKLLEEETKSYLSDIDENAAIRINLILPFYILNDDSDEFQNYAQAWILLFTNYLNFMEINDGLLKNSVDTVSKLLVGGMNFSKLIYMSDVLINKYEQIQKLSPDSFKISRDYIDIILGNDK